jgi:hypothetical protein
VDLETDDAEGARPIGAAFGSEEDGGGREDPAGEQVRLSLRPPKPLAYWLSRDVALPLDLDQRTESFAQAA